MSFYSPSEDSLFLASEVAKFLSQINKEDRNELKFLDLGTGSGIQSRNLINLGIKRKNILASDINPEAVKQAGKLKIKAIKSDLFSKIKGKFNLIIFNPPYLPESKYDKEKDTTGGKLGDETILKFLSEAKNFLYLDGKIFLLLSSLTPKKRIIKEIKKQKMKIRKKIIRKLFFEQLEIWIITI
ncbi:methyltransferase [Candidatus Pacearchaeota archaeon]|nr:methyltransferase [Candidatus Pacearchaeota archaeon]